MRRQIRRWRRSTRSWHTPPSFASRLPRVPRDWADRSSLPHLPHVLLRGLHLPHLPRIPDLWHQDPLGVPHDLLARGQCVCDGYQGTHGSCSVLGNAHGCLRASVSLSSSRSAGTTSSLISRPTSSVLLSSAAFLCRWWVIRDYFQGRLLKTLELLQQGAGHVFDQRVSVGSSLEQA